MHPLANLLGMSTAEADRHKGLNQYVHARNHEDNETSICGSTDGAASLDVAEVNCPACRSILGLAMRS